MVSGAAERADQADRPALSPCSLRALVGLLLALVNIKKVPEPASIAAAAVAGVVLKSV
jgi:hypothetical protein